MALGRNKTSKPRAPLAAHPAFATILGLWVAALLGLAVMILPVALIEGLIGSTGIASVLPSAAPPLGGTARFLIAGAAALGGGVIGFLAARLLARMSGKASRVEAAAEPDFASEEEFADEPVIEVAIDTEIEDEPFPFDVDQFEDELEETAPEPFEIEHREPAILTIEELDRVGLDRAVAKDDAQDWAFEEATHDPEDFNPDVGGWGPEDGDVETGVQTHEEAPALAPEHGIDVLRQRSLKELSLAEMVERFGGALSEHREAIESNPALQHEVQPVIATALKALMGHEQATRAHTGRVTIAQGNAALDISTRQEAEATEEALREALEKLQRMSGNF